MSIDIIYQNVRSLRNKTTEFYNMLTHADADIISVSETWLNEDCQNCEIAPINYQVFRHDRNYGLSHTQRGGGVLTAVRSDILAFRLNEAELNLDILEDIWIKIILPDSTLYICTVYISPHASSHHYNTFFNKVKDNISILSNSSKVIILGDFNLPHINWYDSVNIVEPFLLNTSESYEHFIDMIDMCNLFQFNKIRNTNNKILDFVLSNTEFDGMQVDRTNDSLISKEDVHHPTLLIKLKTKITYLKTKFHKKLNYRKAQYDAINEELGKINWDFINELPLNDSVNKFYALLFDIIHKFTPKYNAKKKNPFWFTPEISRLLRKKEYFRLKWKSTDDPIYYIEFSKLRQISKQKIQQSFDNHLNHIQMNIPKNVKMFWAYTKSKRKSNSYPNTLTYDNKSSTDPVEICNMFSDFFKSTYSTDNPTLSTQPTNSISNNISINISLDSVATALSSVDPNKNGGPDGIPNIFLVNTAQKLSYPLYLIFKKSIDCGIFPDRFKESLVTPIYKKGLKSEIDNYRPVCILNAFSKVFERLVHNKLFEQIQHLIDTKQHGFVKSKSTTTNLMLYTNFIATNLDLGK